MIAFNIIHGTFGEDGQVQEILEERGIPYTGEGVEGSRAAFDKIETKQRFIECGIPTAAFEVIPADADAVAAAAVRGEGAAAGLDRRRLYREGGGADRARRSRARRNTTTRC